MLREFDEFVNFCFKHGGTLRNHKAFGEMSRMLREKIAEQESRLTKRAVDSPKACGEYTPAFNIPGSPCLNCDADAASH